MDSRYDVVRDELGARRRQLLGQVGKEEQGLRHQNAPLDPNSIERANQLDNDDVLAALDASGRQELIDISAALMRIEDGSYGTCAECDEPISSARLKALPTAATCVRCADEAES